MLPITLICATRLTEREFWEKSALGRCLKITYGRLPIKANVFYSNSRGLGACYNEATERIANGDEILLFIHDDVSIVDYYWIDKLLLGFKQFSLLGLAGNRRRVDKQPAWHAIDDKFTWDDPSNLSGIVGHGRGFPCELAVYGSVMQQCKLLDGVLLATKKITLVENRIQFDENFRFHFYDMDLCRQFEHRNLPAGTIPLGIVHESGGNFGGPEWKSSYAQYLAKWKA